MPLMGGLSTRVGRCLHAAQSAIRLGFGAALRLLCTSFACSTESDTQGQGVQVVCGWEGRGGVQFLFAVTGRPQRSLNQIGLLGVQALQVYDHRDVCV